MFAKIITINGKRYFLLPSSVRNRTLKHAVLILDVSYSMNDAPQIFLNSFKESLKNADYGLERLVSVITFANQTEKKVVQMKDVNSISYRQGCTSMRDVPKALNSILRENPESTVYLVTDGAVDDKNDTQQNIRSVFRGKVLPSVDFHLIRFGEHGDTETLTFFSVLSPNPTPVETVERYQIKDAFPVSMPLTVKGTKLSFDGRNFANTICVAPSTIIQADAISSINDEPVSFEEIDISSPEASIAIETIASQLMSIYGKHFLTGNVAEAEAIKSHIHSLEKTMEDLSVVADNPEIHPSMRKIYMNILRKYNKVKYSVFTEFNQLCNEARANKLNSLQSQADFLRQCNSSAKSGKALARRVDFGDRSPDEIVAEVISRIDVSKVGDDGDDAEVSFLSQLSSSETFKEGLKAIILLIKEVGEIEAKDAMTLIGYLGIPANIKKRDYPDPYDVQILELILGSYLSESDICAAAEENFKLTCPGSATEINAVIPVRKLNEHTWGLLQEIAGFQCSFSIRGMIAPVPTDLSALRAAAIKWMLGNFGPRDVIPEISAKTIYYLLDTMVYSMKSRKFEKELLAVDHPGLYLIGGNGVCNPTMVFASYLGSTGLNKSIPEVFHAMMEYYWYFHMKKILRDENREDIIHGVLEIFNKNCPSPGEPFSENPEEVIFPIDVDVNALYDTFKQNNYFPKFKIIANLMRFAQVCTSTDFTVSDIQNAPGFDISEFVEKTFNMPFKAYCVYMTVQAILTKIEDDRVDKKNGRVKYAMFTSVDQAISYIQNLKASYYQAIYDTKLWEKKNEERKLKLNENIEQAVLLEGSEFISHLNDAFPSRDSFGFQDMQRALMEQGNPSKVFTLLTGRDTEKNVVWNNGNAVRTDRTRFLNKLSEEYATIARAIFKEFVSFHSYRESGKPNRHSHFDGKRSYWANGFNTIDDMIDTISDEEWLEYRKIHSGCCGLA